jgi:SAM-dependent methyltransferase
MESSSEKPGAPPVRKAENIHEVRTAENSAAFLLPKLQSMREANPQLKFLDVGAGSGTIAVSFAKLIPDGHVTGIDLNANVLSRAQVVAEQSGIQNIDFQQGSIYKLPFPDETFDITFCHQVLIHIGTPWDALHEMLRVTKKGGIVAAREGDYETESIWPELPGLAKFHTLMVGHMSSGGGTPTAGRQLVSWALKAGAERSQVTLSYSTHLYSTPSERQFSCKFFTAPLSLTRGW